MRDSLKENLNRENEPEIEKEMVAIYQKFLENESERLKLMTLWKNSSDRLGRGAAEE